ncbi:MAG: leucyl/phenylalanyl-tRNA--protein transferase [Nitrospirae bacterium]|nr:MAG: leucyl/phenylalanyl-tRNA--protein transferase [Nitrospirota bacterium]
MTVFQLTDELIFPPADRADPDGLLAVGGDLSSDRILLAYSQGIFPWYSDDSPILWWSPDPRLVLFPDELRVSRSLKQVIKKGDYRVTFNTAFKDVIRNCASVSRKEGDGTWITDEMTDAYCLLHDRGFAQSAEAWYGDELAGGLYGIGLGNVFFGESMFAKRSNASKVAFVALVTALQAQGCRVIDCQVRTGHLMSLGAREIPRADFVRMLEETFGMPA